MHAHKSHEHITPNITALIAGGNLDTERTDTEWETVAASLINTSAELINVYEVRATSIQLIINYYLSICLKMPSLLFCVIL
jgi:hypothetical protein